MAMNPPDEFPPYDDPRRSLWVALDGVCPRTSEVARLAREVLQDAYDVAIAPGLREQVSNGCLVSTLVVRPGDDLAVPKEQHGPPWDFLTEQAPLEAVHARAVLPEPQGVPTEHGGRVFKLDLKVAARAATRHETSQVPVRIGFAVVQGALAGGTIPPIAQSGALSWLERTSQRIAAASAFATLDFVSPFATGPSPYETCARVLSNTVEVERELRGYGWATLLGPAHVESLGGEDALNRAPVADVRPLPAARWLLLLKQDAREVREEDVVRLREFLLPILPAGTRAVSDYPGPVPYWV